jgi:hypothetical protein
MRRRDNGMISADVNGEFFNTGNEWLLTNRGLRRERFKYPARLSWEMEEITPRRKRGRPRKYPISPQAEEKAETLESAAVDDETNS